MQIIYILYSVYYIFVVVKLKHLLMEISCSVSLLTSGSAGAKDEDEQLTQLLKEEEAQTSQNILNLRKNVRTHSTVDDGEE